MKPILFNTEMVRAILDGRKSVTRRVAKGSEDFTRFTGLEIDPDVMAVTKKGLEYPKRLHGLYATFEQEGVSEFPLVKAPFQLGDTLYVRETWAKGKIATGEEPDGREALFVSQCIGENDYIHKEWCLRHEIGIEDVLWRPSIHMPKEAARLFLRVTNVWVERLQDITEEQAEAEGCSAGYEVITGGPCGVEDDPEVWTARDAFSGLWDSTIKKADLPLYGWEANPWVWVIEFERISKEEAQKGGERNG